MPICSFAGHSNYNPNKDEIQNLYNLIEKLITQKGVTEFGIGNYGSFDSISAHAVYDFKNKYKNIKLCLVIPYITKKITEYKELYKKYDEIIMANIPAGTPVKYRIIKCNEYMVNNSDYLIAYVNHNWGGAAKTYNYALKKKNKQTIEIYNIGNLNN